ncbi:MAG: transcriptional repressor [Clostridia bacterium]|nr:transcriptional repressor [Clostridia bacterium]
MRYSRQREALLNLLRSTTTHPDAHWLYSELKDEFPKLSLGTVYRNLRQLVESGDIVEHVCGKTSRFDAATHKHFHIRCVCCNKIFDVPPHGVHISIDGIDGFEVEDYGLSISGKCCECRKKTS